MANTRGASTFTMYCEIVRLQRMLSGYASVFKKDGHATQVKRQHNVIKLDNFDASSAVAFYGNAAFRQCLERCAVRCRTGLLAQFVLIPICLAAIL